MDNVILTGSGGCVPLGGLGPLRAAGYRVVGTDMDPRLSPGRYLCDDFRTVPRALRSESMKNGQLFVEANPDYLARLAELVFSLDAKALLVNPDPEVLAIAASTHNLPVLLPSKEQVFAAHDKAHTHSILQAAGIPLPTAIADDKNFAVNCQAVFDRGQQIFAKEQASAGGQNSRVLATVDEAERVRAASPGMLYYEFLPGDEFAVFLLYRDGEIFIEGSFCKRQYKWGQGLRNESVSDDRLFDIGRRAVTALATKFGERPNGTYHVDLRQTAEGDVRVLEINTARAFGGTPDPYIAFAGGVNLPATYVQLVCGETPKPQRVRGGILQLQHHDYVFVEGDDHTTWSRLSNSR